MVVSRAHLAPPPLWHSSLIPTPLRPHELRSNTVPDYWLHASDAYFRDTSGRAVLLRGINLSDCSKAPPGQTTFDSPESLWAKAEAGGESFVGRPLQIEDGSADLHLARLRAWGFNCLRYVFTWEAIEHEGPGKYDEAFLDYTVAVLRKCKQHGFRVFMDPHQDLFSRFTGGSGAPYWVLPACGIDRRNITATQAAFLQYEWPSPEEPDPQAFPAMIWATNYTRLAAATLGVFFFAGRDFAPHCTLDGGRNIQDYLQAHFIEACRQLALRIRDAGDLCESCVIGWDSLNEPNGAYAGLDDIRVLPASWPLKKGPTPTPLQSMRLGMGQKQKVQYWVFGGLGPKKQKDVEIDPKGRSLWLSAEDEESRGGGRWGWKRDPSWKMGVCPWAAHGVWDVDSGEALRPDYFRFFGGNGGLSDTPPAEGEKRPVEFVPDYWLPFWRSYHNAIRSVHRDAIMFIQPPVFEPPPAMREEDLQSRACTSQHFYDGLTLITKHWNWFNADAVGLLRGKYPNVLFSLKVGLRAIRQGMRDQLSYLRGDTLSVLGKYPTLIGEIGVPMDLDERKTYYGDSRGNGIGDYRDQVTALDASLNACDGKNLLSFTAWSYNPNNAHKTGDGWNGEDFSIWSKDDIKYAPVVSEEEEEQAGESSVAAGGASKSPALRILDEHNNVATESPGALTPTESNSSTSATPFPSSSSSVSLILEGLQQSKERSAHHVPAITNGSRCSQAFCRPYPRATLGTPVELSFDIKSSEFSLTIDVEAQDLAPDDGGRAPPPTEIFVPFLHYAADSLAGAASGNVSDVGRYSPWRKGSRSRQTSLRSESGSIASGKNKGAPSRAHSAGLDSLTPLDPAAAAKDADGGIAPVVSASSSSSSSSTAASSSASTASGSGIAALRRTLSAAQGVPTTTTTTTELMDTSEALSVRGPISTEETRSKLRKLSVVHRAEGGGRSGAGSLDPGSTSTSASAGAEGGRGVVSVTRPAGQGPEEEEELFDLALDYTITAGRVEIVPGSQLLKWYLSSSEEDSEAAGARAEPGQHRITLKRRGGPIAFKQSGSAFEVLVEQMHQGYRFAHQHQHQHQHHQQQQQ